MCLLTRIAPEEHSTLWSSRSNNTRWRQKKSMFVMLHGKGKLWSTRMCLLTRIASEEHSTLWMHIVCRSSRSNNKKVETGRELKACQENEEARA